MLTNEQLDAAAKAAREWPANKECRRQWHANEDVSEAVEEGDFLLEDVPLEGS